MGGFGGGSEGTARGASVAVGDIDAISGASPSVGAGVETGGNISGSAEVGVGIGATSSPHEGPAVEGGAGGGYIDSGVPTGPAEKPAIKKSLVPIGSPMNEKLINTALSLAGPAGWLAKGLIYSARKSGKLGEGIGEDGGFSPEPGEHVRKGQGTKLPVTPEPSPTYVPVQTIAEKPTEPDSIFGPLTGELPATSEETVAPIEPEVISAPPSYQAKIPLTPEQIDIANKRKQAEALRKQADLAEEEANLLELLSARDVAYTRGRRIVPRTALERRLGVPPVLGAAKHRTA